MLGNQRRGNVKGGARIVIVKQGWVGMAKGMTKSQVLAELAEKTGQSTAIARALLDGLAEIAYREAVNGFIIPGICKLSVTTRKARRFRHPVSGQLYQIAARDTLSITALKKCRNAAVSMQDAILTPVTETSVACIPDTLPVADHAQEPLDLPMQDVPPDADGNILFTCGHCGNTVSAPPETAGMAGECPFCGGEIMIPLASPALPRQDGVPMPANPLASFGILGFVTFVCRACNQEIEAPVNMIGMQAACPSCGTSVYVLAENEIPMRNESPDVSQDNVLKPDLRSMTIRMDLSDII